MKNSLSSIPTTLVSLTDSFNLSETLDVDVETLHDVDELFLTDVLIAQFNAPGGIFQTLTDTLALNDNLQTSVFTPSGGITLTDLLILTDKLDVKAFIALNDSLALSDNLSRVTFGSGGGTGEGERKTRRRRR